MIYVPHTMWAFVIVLIILVLVAAIINLNPLIYGFWQTPISYLKETNKFVYLFIDKHVGFIVVQDGDDTLSNHAISMGYPWWSFYRFGLSDFDVPIKLSPPVKFDQSGVATDDIIMHIMPCSSKIVLKTTSDAVISVLQKDAT